MCETVMRTIGLVCVHRRSVRAQNSQDGDWVLSCADDDMEEEVVTAEETNHDGTIVNVFFFLFNSRQHSKHGVLKIIAPYQP